MAELQNLVRDRGPPTPSSRRTKTRQKNNSWSTASMWRTESAVLIWSLHRTNMAIECSSHVLSQTASTVWTTEKLAKQYILKYLLVEMQVSAKGQYTSRCADAYSTGLWCRIFVQHRSNLRSQVAGIRAAKRRKIQVEPHAQSGTQFILQIRSFQRSYIASDPAYVGRVNQRSELR
ncbi:hypothetical protein HBH82_097550 [Parastagonospora nodorum]|nr:hypothetical protein HBH82_097550 [Parastagonospora nodorum]KAH4673734.1 hypothetical protein HBH78_167990 [Parastagonospora nodorum]KAH4707867.1 hypothetical protein HBH67_073610 [Parastagonospora nodorum]KAH4757912.1 hypothetical protein HBH63_223380 [Parastagonospora nodorum]KAH4780869.1 hypothetical protein HBH62_123470 [Parastagonospora nodorum]